MALLEEMQPWRKVLAVAHTARSRRCCRFQSHAQLERQHCMHDFFFMHARVLHVRGASRNFICMQLEKRSLPLNQTAHTICNNLRLLPLNLQHVYKSCCSAANAVIKSCGPGQSESASGWVAGSMAKQGLISKRAKRLFAFDLMAARRRRASMLRLLPQAITFHRSSSPLPYSI